MPASLLYVEAYFSFSQMRSHRKLSTVWRRQKEFESTTSAQPNLAVITDKPNASSDFVDSKDISQSFPTTLHVLIFLYKKEKRDDQ